MTDTTQSNDIGHVDGAAQMDMQALLNLAAPQPTYREVLDQGGIIRPVDGMAMTFSRELTDYILRNHEIFSSRVEMNLGNVRPMIPLNVDPPNHSKYRKLMDPLFAPRQMDAQEEDITRRVNQFMDAFADRGECNFTEEFAEIFPSSVFLGLMGLPESDLRTVLRLRDGSLHPEKIDPDAAVDFDKRAAVMDANGLAIYDYFNQQLDERERQPTDDILSHFLGSEIDGDRLTREDILDTCFLFLIAGLDTVSDTLTCSYAYLANHPKHRQQIVDDPDLIPAAVEELLRWESPVPMGVPRVALARHRAPERRDDHRGDGGGRQLRRRQCRPLRVRRRLRRSLRPREQPPHRVRRWCAPLPRVAPGAPGAAHHVARVAPANPGVPDQARSRAARVPTGTPPRQGPDPRLGLTS